MNFTGQVPLVSVIIQAYQHEQFIGQCLDSVLNQKTTFESEIILGEDDSSDRTRAICEKYASGFPDKIKLFLRSRKDVIYIDGRPSGRFNFIENLKAAHGKYIALLDGDDYWMDENKLQEQVMFLESHPDFALCFTNAANIDKTGQVIKNKVINYEEDVFTHETFVGKISPPTLTTVFRRSALPLDFPGEFYKIANADMFIKAVISRFGKVKFIDKVTAHKRLHGAGVYAGTSGLKKEENKLRTYAMMLNFFSSDKVKETLKTAMSISYARLSYNYLTRGQLGSFFKIFFKSVGFYISNKQFPPLRLIFSKLKAAQK